MNKQLKEQLRERLTAMAIMNIGYDGRKEVIKRNEEMKLVEGEQLTQLELEVAYAERYEGRTDLFPERYPEMNGIVDTEKSAAYWGDMWSLVQTMIASDSPKWTEVDRQGVRRQLYMIRQRGE